MNSSRRRFIIQIIAATSVAATGRMFWIESEEFVPEILLDNEFPWLFLEPDDRLILAAITPVLLDGVMTTPLSGNKLLAYLRDCDTALNLLGELQQEEFKELLNALDSMIGRLALAGVWGSWNDISTGSIEKMLNGWQRSYLDIKKIAYNGLKELGFASWYGNPAHWQEIGYPGPPEIHRK
jgi:hypothetical protein